MFNWFWNFLYGLIKVPLLCIDVIMMIARKLCGIDPIQVENGGGGEEVDLLTYFMGGDSIVDAFGYVCLFGFILLFLFTVFRIIKDQGVFYEKKSPIRICVESSRILLYFLLVPTIMILGTAFISVIMRGIYEATANGNSGLGGSMFVIFAEEAYIGPDDSKWEVLEAFRTGSLEAYLSGTDQFSYYNTDIVSQYFNLSEFNFFLGLVGSISVLVLLGLTLLSFVERIISLVLLFVVSPLPMSASPLDDGERFKIWREQTINKFLTAYGGLLALNIFSLMLPIIANVNFFPMGGNIANLANGIVRLLFVIGGAFACRRGMVLIGNLVSRGAGSQDLMDQSHLSGGMASLGHFVGKIVRGSFGAIKGAAVGGMNLGKSLVHDVSSSVASRINAAKNQSSGGAQGSNSDNAAREAAENRHDGRLDNVRNQNSDAIQNVMQGKSSSSNGAMPGVEFKTPAAASGATSSANNEKNSELNKSAQDDIKNALQNKKSAPPNDDVKSDQ